MALLHSVSCCDFIRHSGCRLSVILINLACLYVPVSCIQERIHWSRRVWLWRNWVAAMWLGRSFSLWIRFCRIFARCRHTANFQFPLPRLLNRCIHRRDLFCCAMFTFLSTYLLIGWSNSFILAFEYFDHFLTFYIVCSGMCTFCWYMVLVFTLRERETSTASSSQHVFVVKSRCSSIKRVVSLSSCFLFISVAVYNY